jgi:hypothetical protein
MIIPFFLNIPPLEAASAEIMRMLVPVGGFAMVLGGFDVTLRHINKVRRQQSGYLFSIVLIAVYIFFLIITLIPGLEDLYTTAYITIIGRVNETVFSLIALFMATIAYRAFKMRTTETFLFGISCLIVLLANAPIGEVIWPGSAPLRDWIMDVLNMAGMRAVGIGVALGIFAYGIRTMLGYERIALGDVEIRRKSGE